MTSMRARPGPGSQTRQMSEGDGGARTWLILVAMLVIAMVIVGGATRLTDSGLSITEWKPIIGAVPPLSEADWSEAFGKYKATPEYAQVNAGMSLSEFKVIFWWEWAHRFLGRFIGLVFALGLIGFWLAGRLKGSLGWKALALFILGGLQGFVGWYMVQSGLVDRVDVSPYRLALHLTIAFAILAMLVWVILDLSDRHDEIRMRTLTGGQMFMALVLVALVFAQVVFGAFVAGTKAGLIYNTWPLMDGRLVPAEFWSLEPWYRNLVEEHGSVQFIHRSIAYVLMVLAIWQAMSVSGDDDEWIARSAALLAIAVIVQVGLGIATLVSAQGEIPIGLGLAHQGWATIVLVFAVWHLHRTRARN